MKNTAKSKLMLLLGMAIALIASEARSQSISLYDNLTAQQPDGTDSNTNFSQNPQNSLVGEDLSTVALETPSNVFRVDSVVIALRSNGTDNDPTSITQAFVEVEFFSGIMADGQASTFAEGTSLGTRRFELGDDDGDSTFGGTVVIDGNSTNSTLLDFSDAEFLIGSGQNIGVTFRFFDGVDAQGNPMRGEGELTLSSRNGLNDVDSGTSSNDPLTGTTVARQYRDENGNGVIDNNDDFAIGGDFGPQFRFAIIGTEIVPDEPQSFTLYDNLTAQQPDGTDSNSNFAQNPQNSLVGDDLSTLAPSTPGNVFRVDQVAIALRSNGTDNDPTFITQAFVEVEFFSGIVADGEASTFAGGTSLGTQRFELGDDDGDSTFGGTVVIDGNSTDFTTLDFSDSEFLIGDGQNIGVTFRFFDGVDAQGNPMQGEGELTLSSRNGLNDDDSGTSSNDPLVGTTFARQYRDENGNGVIDNDDDFVLGGSDFGPQFRFSITGTEIASEGVLLGDVNMDGVVDFLDISPFITLLSTQMFQEEADVNEDGSVDFLDISPFIILLAS